MKLKCKTNLKKLNFEPRMCYYCIYKFFFRFDELWGRIAIDKLRFPVALQIENLKLSLNSNSSCLLAFQYDGKWKEKTYFFFYIFCGIK